MVLDTASMSWQFDILKGFLNYPCLSQTRVFTNEHSHYFYLPCLMVALMFI